MDAGQLKRLLRLGARTARELSAPLAPSTAASDVRDRLRNRERRFLEVLDVCVWPHRDSPVRRLLDWAGYDPPGLARRIQRDGLEQTLSELYRSGVRFDADELAGRKPIVRDGLRFPPRPQAFLNPWARATGFPARTSGTSGPAKTVAYGWPLFREEAAEESLLLECHGLGGAPLALWYPLPPGIAGVHNLLLHWKMGQAPARWFSQIPAPGLRSAPELRAALEGLFALGRLRGSPRARHVPPESAIEVARWLANGARRGERRVLKTFASSAVRMARAANDAGLDLSGQTVFAGGEPLTDERARLLRSVGLSVHARYVATESGLIGGGCGRGQSAHAMHLYADRLSVLVDGQTVGREARTGALSFTSLSASRPEVLLNAELGDRATARRRDCGCALGQAGLDLELSAVHAPDKVAAAGVKFTRTELFDLAHSLVTRHGGIGDDLQLAWSPGEDGPARITITLSPRVHVETEAFRQELLQSLAGLPGGPLAQQLWRREDLDVVRDEPVWTSGQKQTPWIS